MKTAALSILLFGTSVKMAADSEGFRCLEGAKDPAPYEPGHVVRWCEIEKDGRLLYHGSVWRWYRSGQMEGKEFYIYGSAEGEWPSWYEDGRPSSLGAFKKGSKIGLWKYWDEAGWLKTEVTYTDDEMLWVHYYPSGQKKARGKSARSGKIDAWTLWDRDGKEKAKCNFGEGVFAVSLAPCRAIADELEPKGFSQPVPKVMTSDDGSTEITIASQAYRLSTPRGWVADTSSGKRDEVPLVFYRDGGSWRSAPNMYVRILYKVAGASFDDVVNNETGEFPEGIAEYAETLTMRGRLPNGRPTLVRTLHYKPTIETDSPFSIVAENVVHETIGYLDASDQIALMVVLTSDSASHLQDSTPALLSLLSSFRERPVSSADPAERPR